MADGKDMRELVTSCFNGSVLNSFRNHFVKVPLRFDALFLLGELWVVPGVTLDADTPALLSHSENEGPALLWIEVGVCKDKEALVLTKLDVLLKVFKDLPCVKLFDLGVVPNPCLHNALLLQHSQTLFNDLRFFLFTTLLLLDPDDFEPSEEDFGN